MVGRSTVENSSLAEYRKIKITGNIAAALRGYGPLSDFLRFVMI